jgi:hypothetical protein
VRIDGTFTTSYPAIIDQHSSYTRTDSINTSQTFSFIPVKIQLEEFQTKDFTLASDSLSIIVNDDGVYRVSITGHWQWQGSPGTSASAYVAFYVENNQTPLNWGIKRTCDEGDFGTLNIEGIINISSGDKVAVKYYVTSTDMDFQGQNVLDHSNSFRIELNKVSSLP